MRPHVGVVPLYTCRISGLFQGGNPGKEEDGVLHAAFSILDSMYALPTPVNEFSFKGSGLGSE